MAPAMLSTLFVGELIDDVEHTVFAAIVDAALDEVVGPDVLAVLRPQADARPVREPKTASFGLLVGDLQSLAPPDPFHPAVDDRPASLAQQGRDLATAISAILTANSMTSASVVRHPLGPVDAFPVALHAVMWLHPSF